MLSKILLLATLAATAYALGHADDEMHAHGGDMDAHDRPTGDMMHQNDTNGHWDDGKDHWDDGKDHMDDGKDHWDDGKDHMDDGKDHMDHWDDGKDPMDHWDNNGNDNMYGDHDNKNRTEGVFDSDLRTLGMGNGHDNDHGNGDHGDAHMSECEMKVMECQMRFEHMKNEMTKKDHEAYQYCLTQEIDYFSCSLETRMKIAHLEGESKYVVEHMLDGHNKNNDGKDENCKMEMMECVRRFEPMKDQMTKKDHEAYQYCLNQIDYFSCSIETRMKIAHLEGESKYVVEHYLDGHNNNNNGGGHMGGNNGGNMHGNMGGKDDEWSWEMNAAAAPAAAAALALSAAVSALILSR